MDQLFTAQNIISLLTLTFLEIVLGIDNIIFISIAANKLAKQDQGKARNIGLVLAMLFRIVLLFGKRVNTHLNDKVFKLFFADHFFIAR